MNAIVAVDQNWGIGYKGELLARLRADMKHFKEVTMGHPILYGRKTLQTFPKGAPLPGRVNYMFTRQENLEVPDVNIIHSFRDAVFNCPDDTFVIGGGQVYNLMLPCCQTIYVTKFFREFKADTWFRNLDDTVCWRLAEEGPVMEENGLKYQFLVYSTGGKLT